MPCWNVTRTHYVLDSWKTFLLPFLPTLLTIYSDSLSSKMHHEVLITFLFSTKIPIIRINRPTCACLRGICITIAYNYRTIHSKQIYNKQWKVQLEKLEKFVNINSSSPIIFILHLGSPEGTSQYFLTFFGQNRLK